MPCQMTQHSRIKEIRPKVGFLFLFLSSTLAQQIGTTEATEN